MEFRGDRHDIDRRGFLRKAGVVGAASAMVPLLGSIPRTAVATTDDPDQLFKDGRFGAAERGYRRMLRDHPRDAHARAQLGYIALLSNRFGDAEKYLSEAVALEPSDVASAQRLAECFVRQDQLARAVALLRSIGRPREEALAELYSQIAGTPWQISGAQDTRVPFVTLDPLPAVEAVVNGGTPRTFWLDTYATLDLSQEVAEQAGLRALSTISGGVANMQPVTIWLGVLDSLRVGNIEIRNLPVQWSNGQRPPLPDGSQAAGVLGTTLFYHFLTTMNYAGRALILRRTTKTPPPTHGADHLPLWLAGDHYPCTLGSLGELGPRPVTLDTGGIASALDTTVAIAEQAGMTVDYSHPMEQAGTTIYPVKADRISLGSAVGRDLHGKAAEKVFPGFPGPGQSAMFGFDLIANFTHEFFKPFAITFDYTTMRLAITRP